MATTGQDGGGTVYIRPVVSADGVAAGVADIKQEFASIPVAAQQAAQSTSKSLASLGVPAEATANIERFKDAFGGIARATKEELGESARFTNSYVSQLRRTAADVDSVTQAMVNKARTLQSADPRLQNDTVNQTIAGLQKLATQNEAVTAAVKQQAAAQQVANKAASEAAIQFGNFERSAAAARLELLSFGKTASEKYQIRAELLGIDKTQAVQKIVTDLKAAEAAALAAGKGVGAGLQQPMERLGMTAKQTTAALRQVPAQFTDIIVSLQGGQAPLTVLLQQGGQLKDVFGGVGAAAKALGRYVAGLVNPFTLAAAAVGGVAAAYYAGSQEADAFRKALVFSGNQVGLTTGGLADMAKNMGAVSGTTGAAASALATFAASGAVGAAGIQKATEAAIALEKYGGQAVAETVKQFKSLGDDPLKASIRLNDAVNFLTTSLYEQIKALEEQGRTVEAAALAQDAFSKASLSSAGEIQDNLGYIERGWLGVKSAILEAVDAAKGIGRPETIGAQIAAKQALISQYQKNGYDTTKEQAELDALNRRALREQDIATSKAQQKLETENMVAANKILDSFASNQVKMEKEILASRTALVRAGIDNKIVEETIGKIREKYKEKASKPTGISEAAREVEKGLRVYNDLIAKSTDLNADFEEKWNGLSAAYRGRKIDLDQLTAAQKELLSEQRFSKEADKAWADQSAASAKAVADLSKAYDAYVKTLDASAIAVGNQLQKLQDEEAATVIAAAQNISLAQAIEQVTIARLEEAQTKAYANGDQEAGDAIKREIEARKKLATAIGGKEVREANKKAADDAAKAWEKTADKINDSITDALMRGFESGKGFAENLRDSVVNMFKTMVLRPVVQGAVDTASSGATSVAGSIATQMGFTASAAALGPTIGAMVASAMASYAIGDAIAGGKKVGGVSGGTLGQLFGGLPGGLVAQLFGKGEELTSTGDAIRRYDKGGALTENATNGAWFFTNTDAANNLLDELESRYQKAAKALGIGTVATQFDYGSNNRGNFALAGAAGNSRANTGEIAYSAEAMQVAASRAVFAALQGSELPKYLSGLLDSVGDINALSQAQIDDVLNTAQAYKGLHDVMVQMPFEALHDLSYNAAKGLIEFSGGLDKLTQNLGTYYDNFYSAEEKKAQTLANITKTLTDAGALTKTTRTAIAGEFDVQVGAQGDARLEQRYATSFEDIDMPKTREEFRALAESLKDLGGESAQKAYAALLSVSGAFASIVPAAADLNKALSEIASERSSLQSELDSLTMTSTQLLDKQRAALDESNRGLFDQVQAQLQLKDAADKAAASAKETAALQIELLTAQGNTQGAAEALRALETQGFGAVEVAAYDLNAGLRETINTLNATAEAARNAAASQTSLAAKYANPLTVTTASALLPTGIADSLLAQGPTQIRDTISNYIKALDPLTESGRAAIAQVEGLSGALDVLVGEVDRVSSQSAAQAQASAEAYRAQLQANADSAAQAVQGAFDGVVSSVNSLKDAATALYKSQGDAIRDQKSLVAASISGLSNLSSKLKSTYNGMELAGSETATRQLAQATLSQLLATARTTGVLPTSGLPAEQLDRALGAVSRPSEDLFSSYAEYAFDFLKTANDVKSLGELSDAQLSAQELMQRTMDDQLTMLEKSYKAQIDTLDDTLASAQRQVDALNGVRVGIDSLGVSMQNLAGAIAAAQIAKAAASSAGAAVATATTTASASTGSSSQAYIPPPIYTAAADPLALEKRGTTNTAFWRIGDLSYDGVGNAYTAYGPGSANFGAFANSAALEAANNWPKGVINKWAQLNSLPAFAQGINYVPEDMTARIHKGEAVVPAAYNPFNPNAQGAGNARLEKLVEGLTAEVQRLQSIVNDGNTIGRRTADAVNGNPEMPMLVETV